MLDTMKAKPYVGHLVHFTNDLQHTIGRNKFIWNNSYKPWSGVMAIHWGTKEANGPLGQPENLESKILTIPILKNIAI
jgi:hypothetical protein